MRGSALERWTWGTRSATAAPGRPARTPARSRQFWRPRRTERVHRQRPAPDRHGRRVLTDKPWTYTAEGRELLQDIGVNYYDTSYKRHTEVYRSRGLQPSVCFDQKTFGADRLVERLSLSTFGAFAAPAPELLAKSPRSGTVQPR